MKHLLKFPFSVKSNQEEGIIEGYASVFNISDSEDDVILPGAFVDSQAKEVKFLWQHIAEEPIGQILMMYEDDVGLYIKVQLILNVKRACEAYALVKSGVLNGLSIGYIPTSYEDVAKDDKYSRYIKKIDLKEISLVTFPVNKEAKIINIKSTKEVNDELLNAIERGIKVLS